MPSFLSKVFGRKKDDKESPRRVEDTGLLDGKFEAVSPSATKFPEVANERQSRPKDRGDSPLNVFRSKSKSRPSSPEPKNKRVEVPHLSLNLPGLKGEDTSRDLGAVFEADPESQILSEEAIGIRRLTPPETLLLVRACSEAIIARGLETLGVMHPHWHSASPEVQRKLISLFLKSLVPRITISTLSPTPSTIATAFDSELSSTQSPHDVAAVLRWGLRHLQLEGTSFGKDDMWYKTFFDAERSAGYPPNGYSTTLAPLLPTSHSELLTATLEVFSSLAAHAEANGISGSKLSKLFGLWLLTVERAQVDDDWPTFYARWERTGRMLEHLFLSRIRDDATESRMPTRLLELVNRYPYQTDPIADLLARPRFSTIQYDALFVRIETELSATADQPSHHPLRIISEAFRAEASSSAGEHAALWESIRRAGANEGSSSPTMYPGLSHVFADETLRFFSLVPVEPDSITSRSPSFNLYTRPSRRQSLSLGDRDAATTAAAVAATSSVLLKHSKTPTSPLTSSDVNSPIGVDWVTFSTSGFLDDSAERPRLASTLMEKERDMEVTIPRPSSPRLNLFSGGRKSVDTPRKSSDTPRTTAKAEEPKSSSSAAPAPVKTLSKSTHVALVQLDEAFIDFWSDALFDPISSSWPAFIICKLKNAETQVQGKHIEWLVIEQAFKRPPPPPPEASTSSHESPRRTRPSSPNSSKSDGSFTFSSAFFKRFSLFASPGRTTTTLPEDREGTKGKGKRKVVSPRAGEMGEMLREEDEDQEKYQGKGKGKEKDETVRVRVPSPKPKKPVDAAVKKSLDEGNRTNGIVTSSLAAGAAAVVGGAAAAVAAAPSEQAVKAEDSTTPAPAVEPTMNVAPAETVTLAPREEVLGSEPAVIADVPVPVPVKDTLPQEETGNGDAAAHTGETLVDIRAAASEPQVAQPLVEELRAAEPGVVSAVEEANPTQPDVASAVEDIKIVEPEFVSVVEEVKVPELTAAPVVEEVNVPDPDTVSAVEEVKESEHEALPVIQDVKATEPEVTPVVETKAADPEEKEPEAVPAVEAKADELEGAPIVEEVRAPEPEIPLALEDNQVFEVEVESAVDETTTSQPETAVMEETKTPELETAPVVEEIKAEPEVVSAVKDVEVTAIEPEVTPVLQDIKAPEPEVVSTIEKVGVSELELETAVDETSVNEPEVVPAVYEIKPAELEVVPAVEIAGTEAAPAVEEIKVPGAAPVVEEAEVDETTSNDFFDEPREVDSEAIPTESLAEPIIESSVAESELVVTQETQATIEQVVLTEETAEPVVKEVVEPATQPNVREKVESVAEPVNGEAVQPVIEEVLESIVPEIPVPVFEEVTQPVGEVVSEGTAAPAAQSILQPSSLTDVQEPFVEGAAESAADEATETVVEPIVEEPAIETAELAADQELFTEEVAEPEAISDKVSTSAVESESESKVKTPAQAEETVEATQEPTVIDRTAPVEPHEAGPVVREDLVRKETLPTTSVVEEAPIDPPAETAAERVTDLAAEAQTSAVEKSFAQEPVAVVVEEAPIAEPTVGSGQINTFVQEEAVVEETMVGEAATDIPVPIKEEITPTVEDSTPVDKDSMIEPSAPIEVSEPLQTASDQLAVESIQSETVAEKLAPIVEEPSPSTAKPENNEVAEGISAALEPDGELEVKEPAPIDFTLISADVPQETAVIEDLAGELLAPTEMIAPSEDHTPTATGPDVKTKVLPASTEAEAVPITVEQPLEENANVDDSEEETHVPTEELQTVTVESTPSAPELDTLAPIVTPSATEPELEAEIPAPAEVEASTEAEVVAPAATEVEFSQTNTDEPLKESVDAVEIIDDTASPATEEVLIIGEELKSSVTESEPQINVTTVPTEVEPAPVPTDQPVDENQSAVTDELSDTITTEPTEETPVPISEAPATEESVSVEPKPESPTAIEVEPSPIATADHPVEENIAPDDPTEEEIPVPTEDVTSIASATTELELEPETSVPIRVEPTLIDETVEKSPDVVVQPTEVPVPAETHVIAPVVEEPMPSTVVKPEPEPDLPATVEVEPTLAAADQSVEESTLVVDAVESTPVPTQEATPIVEELSLSAAHESEPEPKVSVPVEDEPVLTAEDESNDESTPVIHTTEETPTAVTTEEVTRPVAEESPEPDLPATDQVERSPVAADQFVEESTVVADVGESSPVPTQETVDAVESTSVPTQEATPIVEEFSPSVTPESDKVPTPVEDEPETMVEDESTEEGTPVIPTTEQTSAVTTEEVTPPVAEESPEPDLSAVEPTLVVADQPVEETTVVTDVGEPSPDSEPEFKVSTPVEAEPISMAKDESIEESTVVLHTTEETPAVLTEEVIAPVAEESVPSAAEADLQAVEAPAPVETESTPAVVEGDTPAIDSNVEGPAPIVEEAVPAVEELALPAVTELEVEPEMEEHAPIEVEATPVVIDEPKEETVISSVNETQAVVTEEVVVPVTEPTLSDAELELVVETPTPIEAESTLIVADELVESPESMKEDSAPATEGVSVAVIDEEPQLSAAEPELATEEVTVSVEGEPVSATAEESAESTLADERVQSSAEVSVEEVPVVEEELAPVETTNIEEKTVEAEGVPEDIPAADDETANGVPSNDDVVIAENGNGHSASVKEEEEPAKSTIVANSPDSNAVTPVEE